MTKHNKNIGIILAGAWDHVWAWDILSSFQKLLGKQH